MRNWRCVYAPCFRESSQTVIKSLMEYLSWTTKFGNQELWYFVYCTYWYIMVFVAVYLIFPANRSCEFSVLTFVCYLCRHSVWGIIYSCWPVRVDWWKFWCGCGMLKTVELHSSWHGGKVEYFAQHLNKNFGCIQNRCSLIVSISCPISIAFSNVDLIWCNGKALKVMHSWRYGVEHRCWMLIINLSTP